MQATYVKRGGRKGEGGHFSVKPLTDLRFDSVESISDRKFERGGERAERGGERERERERRGVRILRVHSIPYSILPFSSLSAILPPYLPAAQ